MGCGREGDTEGRGGGGGKRGGEWRGRGGTKREGRRAWGAGGRLRKEAESPWFYCHSHGWVHKMTGRIMASCCANVLLEVDGISDEGPATEWKGTHHGAQLEALSPPLPEYGFTALYVRMIGR